MSGTRLPSILVVEDDTFLTRALVRILRDEYDVTWATSCRDALQMISGHAYDAVLSDIHLTDGDGVSLGEELVRRDPRYFGSIVFMSGGDILEEQIARMQRMEHCFLKKPFSDDEVRAALRSVVQPGVNGQAAA